MSWTFVGFAGPNFVEGCNEEQQAFFVNKNATWDDVIAATTKALASDGTVAPSARCILHE